MATATLERQVVDAEKRFWEAIKSRDSRAVETLTGPTYTMIMEEGVYSSSGRELAEMLTGDETKLRDFKLDDASIMTSKISDDVSAVAYRVHSEYERNGKLEKRDTYALSIWKRDGDTWRVVAGADTPARA
jgi:hypothetical protein